MVTGVDRFNRITSGYRDTGATVPGTSPQQRPVLVVINADTDPIGSLGPPLAADGFELDQWDIRNDPCPGHLDSYAALMVLGGPTNPDDDESCPSLQIQRDMLAYAVRQNIPTIAVCLGAQLLGQAHGSSATQMTRPRIGWTRQVARPCAAVDPLRDAWLTLGHVMEWHEFRVDLPAGATLLAGSLDDVQAFRVGACAWGFQYHLETDPDAVANWLQVYRDDFVIGAHVEEILAFSRRTDIDHTAHGLAVGRAFSSVVARSEKLRAQ
jgi:GMP synthase (glutamine-hydrolysing)